MKQRNVKKKAGSLLLAAAMIVTSFPAFSIDAHAADLLDSTQFATVDDLKSFDTDDTYGTNPAAKVYFGSNNQQWWIVGAGSQNDALTLFAASPLGEEIPFEPDMNNNKTDPGLWADCFYSTNPVPTEVCPNHYGASFVRKELKRLESSYFTNAEHELMNETKIYTNDMKNKSVYFTKDRLYLAYGDLSVGNNQHITVGTNSAGNLNDGLRIDISYWWEDFNLRAPHPSIEQDMLGAVVRTTNSISYGGVKWDSSQVPAFELNLSSVIFASAAPAASDGKLTLQDVDGNGAFTLRYQPQNNIGTATISKSKQSVAVTDVANENTYLVVQNNAGAWAKKVSGDDLVFASEMDGSLTSFENCKVWIETTSERITYAKEAVQGNGFHIKVTAGENMTVTEGEILQLDVQGAIDEIKITANNGYYFPEDYSVADQAGISVTRKSHSELTITGTPTNDVLITLPAATQKSDVTAPTYTITVDKSSLTFDNQCIGYEDVSSNRFSIKNTGNAAVTNINVALAGTNAVAFILDISGMQKNLAPDGTTTFSVKPNAGLEVGTYKAELQITGEVGITKTVPVSFTVKNHEYGVEWKSDETNHWKECKNCNSRSEEAEHTFEWVIDKEPTEMEKGSKHEECEVCGYKKTSVEIPVVKPSDSDKPTTDKPNTDKTDTDKPNTDKQNNNTGSVETGDQTNVGFYTFLFTMSAFCIVILLVWKKKNYNTL